MSIQFLTRKDFFEIQESKAITQNTQIIIINNTPQSIEFFRKIFNKISDTFSVKRKGPVVIITQKYIPDEPLEHPNAIGVTLQDKFPVEVYYSSNTIDSNVKKSAGDKVQDLIGIVSNAGKLTDLQINRLIDKSIDR